jgi:hypothetical protein
MIERNRRKDKNLKEKQLKSVEFFNKMNKEWKLSTNSKENKYKHNISNIMTFFRKNRIWKEFKTRTNWLKNNLLSNKDKHS